ncbi:hypothetical protein BDN72DRAFT_841388, partial [Pluteus cervinus]
ILSRTIFVFLIRAGPLVRWICSAGFGHPLPNALRDSYSQSRARLVRPSTTFNSIAIRQGYLLAHIKNSSYLLSTSQCPSPHDLRLRVRFYHHQLSIHILNTFSIPPGHHLVTQIGSHQEIPPYLKI